MYMNEPLVVLKGLEGNSPTHLSGLQVPLSHNADLLKVFWSVLFVAVLLIVFTKHIAIPLFRRAFKHQ